ncbi:MAG: redoxin domain-containing protein [Lentimicrobiaceae bacterium]|nr:redoxin domain-containing protein [Lentimicrobiaceae bacterium]
MKNLLIAFIVLFPPVIAVSQNYTINGTITGVQKIPVYLYTYYGEKTNLLDSTVTSNSGNFTFLLKNATLPGILKINIGKKTALDIIFNYENISFQTNLLQPLENTCFTASHENIAYYFYLSEKKATMQALELLHPLINEYPLKDDFFTETKKEFINLQAGFGAICDSIIAANPGSFVAKIVRMEKFPPISPELTAIERNNFMRTHFFDGADFSDTTLIKSNIISSRIITYLSFYRNPQLDKDEQEALFIKGIDTIMQKVATNETVYAFVLEYLINGFQKFGYEKVLNYLATHNTLAESCINNERKQEILKKIGNLQRLAIGKTASEIAGKDLQGKPFSMAETSASFTLIVFWASWCPHCSQMLPRLWQLADTIPSAKFQIITVSIDTDESAYKKAIQNFKGKWIHLFDGKGWDGKIVSNYDVFATPTMFLLDNNKTILAKPITYEELIKALRDCKVL